VKHYRYAVVLEGALCEGCLPEQVAANLARLFKCPPERMGRVLGQAPRVIKSGLDPQAAQRYLEAITRAGAVCRLVEEPSESPEEQPSPPLPGAAPPPLPAGPCPKCGREILAPEGSTPPASCPACGIVIAKFLKARAAAPTPAAEEDPAEGPAAPGLPPPPTVRGGTGLSPAMGWGIAACGALLVILAAVLWLQRPRPAVPPASAPTAKAAPAETKPTATKPAAAQRTTETEFATGCLASMAGLIIQHFYTHSTLPADIGPVFAAGRATLPAPHAAAILRLLEAGELPYRMRGGEAFDLALRLDTATWLVCRGEPLKQSWTVNAVPSSGAQPPW
jgi:hypothetical protein